MSFDKFFDKLKIWNEIDKMKLIKNKIDKILKWNWFDKIVTTSCDHGAKSLSFLFWFDPNDKAEKITIQKKKMKYQKNTLHKYVMVWFLTIK